jgi:hypothetical protein
LDQILVRFTEDDRGDRKVKWDSPVEGGLAGQAGRIEVDAIRDAAVGIPEANWGGVFPRAVTAAREVGEGEMAAIGAAWHRARPKFDSKVARHGPRLAASKHELDLAKSNADDMEEGRLKYLKELDEEYVEEHFKRGVTKDDKLRKYETRFSVRSMGYWFVIGLFTVAEFPLNEKVFEALGDESLAYVVAGGLGLVLIAAAHFVGVTFRRFADTWEGQLFDALDAEAAADKGDKAAEKRLKNIKRRLPRRVGLLRTIKQFFVGRPEPKGAAERDEELDKELDRRQIRHIQAAGWVAVGITLLVIVSAMFLGYARARLVENEAERSAIEAGQTAFNNCDLTQGRQEQDLGGDGGGATVDCEAERADAEAALRDANVSLPIPLSTLQYGVLQILIFSVAAALTFHHYNEVIAALKQAQARLNYLRWREKRARNRHKKREDKMTAAVTARWATYGDYRSTAEAVGRYYRSIIDNYYEANLQARADAAEHGAEISSQPRPMFRYPSWMFEDYTIPEEGFDSSDLPTHASYLGFRLVPGMVRLSDDLDAPSSNGSAGTNGDVADPSPPKR